MLWLACHFPLLALEVPPPAPGVACVVADNTVQLACPLARAAGIQPGMRLASARALVDPLQVRHVVEADRAQALADLAPRLARITSYITLDPAGGAVVGEVDGSRRLFGGLAGVRRVVTAAFAGARVTWHPAVAPTPAAAALLATHRPGTVVRATTDLAHVLGPLPAGVLRLGDRAELLLRRIGVRTVAEALALPRAGLARRLGLPAITALEQLLGERPDPRPHWTAPERFQRAASWDYPLQTLEALTFPLQRLVGDLAVHLAYRGERATAWTLTLSGEDLPPHAVAVAAAAGAGDLRQLLTLTLDRLGSQPWPGPVTDVALTLDATRAAPGTATMFGATGDEHAAALLDRLRARLGDAAVYSLVNAADHRPEHAQRRITTALGPTPPPGTRHRPTWLLPSPQPWRGRPGDLLAGPERVESGWWDADARRDYYIARGGAGETLWVYQDLRTAAWFVHGWFG